MLFSVEQAFVGRDEKLAPLKTPAWEAIQHCDMKLPTFTRPLYEVGEHNTKKFLFLFLNSDTFLSDSVQKISPAFDILNEIE